MKKLAMILSLFALMIFGGIKACEYSGMRYSAKFFPEPIEFTRTLVHQPGCGIIWCAGGSLFEMSEQQANQIKTGGLAYLNSLSSISAHDRPIGEWNMASSLERPPSPMFGKDSKAVQKRLLYEAISQEDCYVSGDNFQEPLLIICAEAKIAYSGWFD